MKIFSLMLVFTSVMPCAAQSPAYTVDDVGTLGGLSSTAAAVNNNGQVVGTSDLEDGKHFHAFFFDGNRLNDIGTFGGTDSTAISINDNGQAVGQADIASSELFHAFRWEKGTLSDLHILDKGNSQAACINGLGQVAGWAFTPFKFKNGIAVSGDGKPRQVFLQTDNITLYLPDPSATGPEVLGINGAGKVVGSVLVSGSDHIFLMPDTATQGKFSRSAITTDYTDCACIWQNGKITLLKSLGGQSSEARAVNSRGDVAGKAALRHDKTVHACLWQHGMVTARDLDTLGGVNSQANALNSIGQIVGWSDAVDQKSQHAFLYDNGKMIDLNTLIDHKYGWVLLEATGISDTGYICGTGIVDGVQHAFRLTPISAVSK